MAAWQIIWFIVSNIPTIIKLVKEIKDALGGDHKDTAHAIKAMTAAIPENKLAIVDKNGSLQLIRSITA